MRRNGGRFQILEHTEIVVVILHPKGFVLLFANCMMCVLFKRVMGMKERKRKAKEKMDGCERNDMKEKAVKNDAVIPDR